MGGRVSDDQCEIILWQGGSREPNPDAHRSNMGKARTQPQQQHANDVSELVIFPVQKMLLKDAFLADLQL